MQKKFFKIALLILCTGSIPVVLGAQQPRIANLRAYDQTGINVFEDPKDTASIFGGIKVKFGAGFTQQFQNLKHENPGASNNQVGSFANGISIPGNRLKIVTAGFQTAQANLYVDVQLADGIRLNITTYLSTKHHNETWVKGGYLQFDKLPFKGQVWADIMKVTTIKIGHFEVDYGDEHYRRSDGGQSLYNPFMEGKIMDEYATEIGGEVYIRKHGFFAMAGLTNGMIKGNVDSLYKSANPDGDLHKSPSLLLKAGFDKQLAQKLRVRLSGSYYGNQSSGGNTLFGGDRSGSNYQLIMEENAANPASTTGSGSPLAFSGRFNPGFSKKINSVMLNGFVKAGGLEMFGTYEKASGRTAKEEDSRKVSQYAADAVYRFGKTENIFIGVRYNTVTASLSDNAAGTGAGPIDYSGNVTINRFATSVGWFLTRNILMKAEYVVQKYKDFPGADYRAGGKFDGYVIEAIIGF
jgi:hypothetical protein